MEFRCGREVGVEGRWVREGVEGQGNIWMVDG